MGFSHDCARASTDLVFWDWHGAQQYAGHCINKTLFDVMPCRMQCMEEPGNPLYKMCTYHNILVYGLDVIYLSGASPSLHQAHPSCRVCCQMHGCRACHKMHRISRHTLSGNQEVCLSMRAARTQVPPHSQPPSFPSMSIISRDTQCAMLSEHNLGLKHKHLCISS